MFLKLLVAHARTLKKEKREKKNVHQKTWMKKKRNPITYALSPISSPNVHMFAYIAMYQTGFVEKIRKILKCRGSLTCARPITKTFLTI